MLIQKSLICAIPQKIRKSFSKVHIDGRIWQYKIGTTYVVIYSPNGEKYLVNRSDIDVKIKFSLKDGEAGWEKYKNFRATSFGQPSRMKQFIKDNYYGK